jgi:hypothetical protein
MKSRKQRIEEGYLVPAIVTLILSVVLLAVTLLGGDNIIGIVSVWMSLTLVLFTGWYAGIFDELLKVSG